jgi:hypothetical protein
MSPDSGPPWIDEPDPGPRVRFIFSPGPVLPSPPWPEPRAPEPFDPERYLAELPSPDAMDRELWAEMERRVK